MKPNCCANGAPACGPRPHSAIATRLIRSPHPTDGRTTLIELTQEGRTLAKRATAALNSEVFAQSGFAEQDVDQLIRILGTFRRNAGDFSE